ncbi:MAG: hypothetical protein MI923_09300 [Phycisphaerales bacterium]|nr:hypothetical protein [Phycisphaerales bacterium]
MAQKQNQTKFGTKAEKKVADQLRRMGAKVERSPGSRGAADLKVKFDKKTWDIQVKASRTNEAAELSARDRQRLNSQANRDNATPVLAQVTPNGIEYKSTRSGRKVDPKSKKS